MEKCVSLHFMCCLPINPPIHSHCLANASPNITVDGVFNVTAGKVNTLTLTTDDPDGDPVNVTLTSTLPVGATFENNVYTWTPTSMELANISYVNVLV